MPEVEPVCDVEALVATAPDVAESGDAAALTAARGDAAADGIVAEPFAPEISWVACPEVPPLEVLGVLPRSVVSVWLISISCSRLFTLTSWLMYSFGSVSAVGSWFCISVTNSVRKSLAEMAAELPLESLELFVPLLPDVELAMGVAALRVNACPAVTW